MPLAVVTTSHSPLMGVNHPPEDIAAAVEDAFGRARDFINAFDPELVVIFAPDHYNGVFYDLMPPFCVGTAATAVGDYGTGAGPLDVDRPAATRIVRHVLESDIDAAISERMHVDHGFAQPLEILLGSIDARPTVPIFINSVAVPMGPVRRARLFGHAVGEALLAMDRRVLVIGSGGLSHDPPVPELETATPEVAERLIAGRNPSAAERAAREEKVLRAGQELAAGTSPIKPLNPNWDEEFLKVLAEGRLPELDARSNDWFVEQAGHSAHEVRTWIAAYAALNAAGPHVVTTSFYRPIPEWIAGFAVTTALPSAS